MPNSVLVISLLTATLVWPGIGCAPQSASEGAPRSTSSAHAQAPGRDVTVAAAAAAKPSRIVLTPTDEPGTSQRISWSITKAYPGQGVSIRPLAGGAAVFVAATRQPATSVRYSGTKSPRYTATVTGLTPGTSYAYQVVNPLVRSDEQVFTTANPKVKSWQMLAFGDTQIDNRTSVRRIIDSAVSAVPSADLMLASGDVVDRPYLDSQWRDLFTAMGSSARTRNWLVAIGNHEQCLLLAKTCNSGNAQAFRSYFDWPDNGYPGQGQTWFYLDYQDVRIVVLDSFGGSLSAQARFLDQALGSNPNTWSIVLMHASPFSARAGITNPAVLAAFQPIIEARNVDLVLTGHDHSYVRGSTRADGPVYVISDSGPKFYPTDYHDWLSNGATPQVTAAQTATYQVITISGQTLNYKAVVALKGPESSTPLAEGQTLDELTITKDPGSVAAVAKKVR